MTAYTAWRQGTDLLAKLVNLNAHGFNVGQLLIYDGAWVLAQADTSAHCAGVVMVSLVPSVDTFYVTQAGWINNLTTAYIDGHPANPNVGSQYYVSALNAGYITSTPPGGGNVVLPCFVFDTFTTGFFFPAGTGSGGGGGGSGITWHTATINTNMAVNQGYICSSGGTLNMLLPAVSALGDTVRVANASGQFSITQNGGQSVIFNTSTSTVGGGGSITTSIVGSELEIVCIVPNSGWMVMQSENSGFVVV